MRYIILFWFKIQAAKATKSELALHFDKKEIQRILKGYWKKYLRLKPEVPSMPTLGGSIMVHLSAMSVAFYQELTEKGKSEEDTTQFFYEIAWKIYQKMAKFSWWLARFGNRNDYNRLRKATKLFRAFPFNSPSYQWRDVETNTNTVGFDCLKCPVADYFQSKNLSKFCTATWCALDYPLATMWNSKLKRTGSIAGGAKLCDFRWTVEKKT